jgi:hypothetical protein
MSDLTQFRDHCRKMATARHLPECSFTPPRHMYAQRPDPSCPGCVTDRERETWERLADEVDAYRAPQVDLFGGLSEEPA